MTNLVCERTGTSFWRCIRKIWVEENSGIIRIAQAPAALTRLVGLNPPALIREILLSVGKQLTRSSARYLRAVAATLNGRPRKSLSWRTPAEAFNDLKGRSKNVLRGPVEAAQYASKVFRRRLFRYRMKQSMSRKGDCRDNAVAESFFATLKKELV